MRKLILCITVLALSINIFAQPTAITWQGKLLDAGGNAISDPALEMTFAMYDAETGGIKLWPAADAVSKTVDVNQGLYSVQLGTGAGDDDAFTAAMFDGKSPWLEVSINGSVLTRTPVTGVPFALISNELSAGGWAALPGLETDPVFAASVAAGITASNTLNWDAAYSWGDHSAADYLTVETDPVFAASVAAGITASNTLNWDAAYSWGDHSALDYLTVETDPLFTAWDKSEGISITVSQISDLGEYIQEETDPLFTASPASGITNNNMSNWNEAHAWGDHAAAGYAPATLGVDHLQDGKTGAYSIFLGTRSGATSTGQYNTALGFETLFENTTGASNSAFGYKALNKNVSGIRNTAIGHNALYQSTGNRNTAIGYRAGFNNTGHDNVFIGNSAGTNETGSHKLIIHNRAATEPLIYGEFNNRIVEINGGFSTKGSKSGFIATFENESTGGNSGGIKIKLGKTAARNYSGAATINTNLNNFIKGDAAAGDITHLQNLFGTNTTNRNNAIKHLITESHSVETTIDDAWIVAATVYGTTRQVTGFLVNELNKNLKVPRITVFPGFKFGRRVLGVRIGFTIKPTTVGPFQLVKIPNFMPAIPGFPSGGIGLTFPNLVLTEQVSNPLSKTNNFIQFTDKNDFVMGTIRAQSIVDWRDSFFTYEYFYSMLKGFSGLDKFMIVPEMRVQGRYAAKAYLEIGVEYSSGNGDYAEWLERIDHQELITAGDIVAIKGGRITKDLADAEQVMAVSQYPIIVGNAPSEETKHLGNNVAFMGQIPVKIMGQVNSGDYIVGKSGIPGYGVAVAPENMTIDDYALAVGRSWESCTNGGPKRVQTVVGVSHGDYLHILQRYEQTIRESELRLNRLESRLEQIIELLPANHLDAPAGNEKMVENNHGDNVNILR